MDLKPAASTVAGAARPHLTANVRAARPRNRLARAAFLRAMARRPTNGSASARATPGLTETRPTPATEGAAHATSIFLETLAAPPSSTRRRYLTMNKHGCVVMLMILAAVGCSSPAEPDADEQSAPRETSTGTVSSELAAGPQGGCSMGEIRHAQAACGGSIDYCHASGYTPRRPRTHLLLLAVSLGGRPLHSPSDGA